MELKTIKTRDFLLLGTILSLFLYFLFTENYIYISLLVIAFLSYAFAPAFVQNTSVILQGIIFLVPLSIDVLIPGGTKISAPSELLAVAVFGLFFYRWLGGFKLDFEIIKHPISILLILELCWTIFTTVTSQMPVVSLKRLVMKSLFIVVFYFVFVDSFRKPKELKSLFWLYGLGIIVPIISTIYNHSLLDFNQRTSIYVSKPFFVEHTLYAASVTFIIPFFTLSVFSKSRYKWGYFSILSLLVSAMVLSYSRAAWISLGVALIFYILTKIRISFKLFSFGMVLILGLTIFNFDSIYENLSRTEEKYGNDVTQHLTSVTNLQNDASNLERINRWVSAVEMFKDKPITGFGPGTYQFVYDDFQRIEFMTRISTHHGDKGNAHSEYLMYLSETGFIGFLIFIIMVIYTVNLSMKLLYSNISKSEKQLVYAAILGLITFYVHGLFNSFMDSEKMIILYFGSLAVLVRLSLNSDKHGAKTHEKVKGSDTDRTSISNS
jgi:O-antigen ligase